MAVGQTPRKKVGVVLSGGGGLGMAHIGVLQAFEDHGIPVDFVTGTSAGAMVGGFYAAGYAPGEILQMSVRDAQNALAPGLVLNEAYYFRRHEPDATFLNLPLSFFGTKRSLPESLFSDYEINLLLNRYLSGAGAACRQNFDSLMIPYRAMCADIFEQKALALNSGSLAFAVRASMAVPLFFPSASNDRHKNLFDGGVYDNFPVQPMLDEFNPDYVVGVNVTGSPTPKEEVEEQGNFIRFLLAQGLIDQHSWEKMPPNGFLIMPDMEGLSVGNFSAAHTLAAYKRGYDAAVACIEELKEEIGTLADTAEFRIRREAFRKKWPPIKITSVEALGVGDWEKKFIERSSRVRPGDTLDFEDLKKRYFRLRADGKYGSVIPELRYDGKSYAARFHLKPRPRFNLRLGGAFFTPTDHQLQIAASYGVVTFVGIQGELDLMRGSVYNHAKLRGRVDFPTRLPFLLELDGTFLQWDLQRPIFTFFNFNRSAGASFESFELKPYVSFPYNPKTKTSVGHTFQNSTWSYFDKPAVLSTDTLDRTRFFGSSTFLVLENNSLNEKMYAGKGTALYFSLRFNRGREEYIPGPFPQKSRSAERTWFMARASYQSYVRLFNKTAFGVHLDGAVSTLPPQATLTANTIMSPLFMPLQESPVIFIPRLYSKMFGAVGLKFVYYLTKKIQVRTEWYYMHNFLYASRGSDGAVGEIFRLNWEDRMIVGTLGASYDTRVGPIAVFVNYYDRERIPFRPVVHVGYMLFTRTPWY